MTEEAEAFEEESWDSSEYSYSYSDWISDFTTYKPFENWFAQVSETFLDDNFNLYGLSDLFSHYNKCISILRNENSISDFATKEKEVQILSYETQQLYLLIHQRYIQSQEGLSDMIKKFNHQTWGVCPRVACEGFPVLPYGISSKSGVSGCLVFCPRCRDVYTPKVKGVHSIDGCAFGPNFASLFLADSKIGGQLVIPEVKNIPLSVYGYKLSENKRKLDRTLTDNEYYSSYEEEEYYEEDEDYQNTSTSKNKESSK